MWVFVMDLSGLPNAFWDAIKTLFNPSEVPSSAKSVVFPADRELWRFAVSTTLHAIWIECLRRIKDPNLPNEAHNAKDRTHFRSSLTRFWSSTHQPADGEDIKLLARAWSALADCLICLDEPMTMWFLPSDSNSYFLYVLFFDGGSRGNPGPGGAGAVIIEIHILSQLRVHYVGYKYGIRFVHTTSNVAEYRGLLNGPR